MRGITPAARRAVLVAAFAAAAFAGCKGQEQPNGSAVGPGCNHSDPDMLCLSVKYLAYKDDKGNSIVSASEVADNIRVANSVWKQCKISFAVENFAAVDPATYGLSKHPTDISQMTSIRAAFAEQSSILVVSTNAWQGSLGSGAADAWTEMPPAGPFGVVLDQDVATYSIILAHELGHYLNLDHVQNTADVMNPVIYTTSTDLTEAQCTTARDTAFRYWSLAMR